MVVDDIYLSMLRFGKIKLGNGFTNQEMVDFLNSNGYKDLTILNIIFHQYFYKVYFSKEDQPKYLPHHSELFYLRPECYMQLLEYDNMLESRREAKQALYVAIAAIVLTLISIIVSIFK